MDRLFLTRTILSFLIAGSGIALLTLLAERLGSRLGGLFANLPSNILISLIFIALAHDIPFVASMMPAIPIGMLIDTAFLFVMMITLRNGILVSLLASLLTWFLLAWSASMVPATGLWTNVCIYAGGALVLFLIAEYGMRIPAAPGSGKRYTGLQIAIRALFAGGLVAGVIVISGFVPPYATGIISTFPAVLMSSMVILYINQGANFARATGKILILSSSNIVVYAISVYYLFPVLGIAGGTIVSFLAAFFWVLALRPITSSIISK